MTQLAALTAQEMMTGDMPDKLPRAQLLLRAAKSMPQFLAMVEAAGI